MLARDRIELLQSDAIRVIALVLAGDVRVAGARSGLQLDDWANVISCD